MIAGTATGSGQDNVINAYKWSYLHWGFGAWSTYGITGMAMAYFAYRRGLPLTVRSSLTSVLGKHLSGPVGNIIDMYWVLRKHLALVLSNSWRA